MSATALPHDIESPANPRIQRLARLRQRRARDAESVFVVEEERILARAIAAGCQPIELYWCPELARQPVGVEVSPTTASATAIDKASYRSTSTGIVAVFSYLSTDLADLNVPHDPVFVVVEGLEKPGNLGAIMRVGDAGGVAGVIVVDAKADPFNPNVVRSSTGAVFTVPLAMASSVAHAADWLASHGVRSIAAVPGAGSKLWATDLTGPCAIWIGAEKDGLTRESLALVETRVTIPMLGSSDSLNSSVAAALVVYEGLRQRSRPE